MVDNNQAGNAQSAEKGQNGQLRYEQPKSEQPRNEQQSRSRNNQGYSQGQRQHNQARQQNTAQNADTQVPANRDPQGQNQSPNANQSQNAALHSGQNTIPGRFQSSRGNVRSAKQHEPHNKENGQLRGYYRDRDKSRDAERDGQPRQHSGSMQNRYGGSQRSRAEETIDDIRQDIVRLEKEIDLEIKEIRSMKL